MHDNIALPRSLLIKRLAAALSKPELSSETDDGLLPGAEPSLAPTAVIKPVTGDKLAEGQNPQVGARKLGAEVLLQGG